MLLLLSLSCPRPTTAPTPQAIHETPAATPVVETVAMPGKPEGFPAGWHTGWQESPEVQAQPYDLWSMVLDGPIVWPVQQHEGRIFAVGGGTLVAVNLKGELLWRKKGEVLAAGMLENGLAVGYDDHYEIVDPRDGRLLFDENTPDLLGVPVDFPGGLAWLSTKGKLSGPGWSLELGGIPSGPPSWDVGETSVLFVGTVEGELVAVSVSPKEAGILWRASLPGPVISSPVLGEERVIVGVAAEGDEPGGVVAFDRVGQEVWRFRTGFQPGGSPALGKQVWIADRDGIIYALDPQSGVEQWRLEGVSDCKTTPVWAGNSLYVGFGDGRLIRVDLDDGGKAWSFQGGAPITGDPVVAGGMIVAGSASGRLFAIK